MLIYSFTNSLPVQQETQQGRRVLNNGTGKPVVWRGFRLQAFHTFPLRCPRGIHSDVPLPYRSTAVWEKFSRKTDYAYCAYCMGKVFPENWLCILYAFGRMTEISLQVLASTAIHSLHSHDNWYKKIFTFCMVRVALPFPAPLSALWV